MIDGKKLRELREAAQLTQEELADRVGVCRTMITRAEIGSKDLSLGAAAAVARVLGCKIDDFVRNEGGAA